MAYRPPDQENKPTDVGARIGNLTLSSRQVLVIAGLIFGGCVMLVLFGSLTSGNDRPATQARQVTIEQVCDEHLVASGIYNRDPEVAFEGRRFRNALEKANENAQDIDDRQIRRYSNQAWRGVTTDTRQDTSIGLFGVYNRCSALGY